MKDKYSRRALLKALGVGAAVLPLLNNEWASAATDGGVAPVTGTGGFPKRLIAIAWTNGVYQQNWWAKGNSTDLTTGNFLPILKPLEPWKSKLLIPHNIALQTVYDSNQYGGHSGYPCIFTGTQKGTSPSIDQLIANNLPNVAKVQLNLGCNTGKNSLSWKGGGQSNTPETSPQRVFSQLFAGANLSSAQIGALQIRRKSVLDLVSTQLTGFMGRVGKDDQAKIQSHLDAVRTLETDIAAASTATSCTPPVISGGAGGFDVQVDLMMRLAAASVKCGISRAVTMELADDGGANNITFPWLKVSGGYHDLAHLGGGAAAQKTLIDTWWYSQVATLIGQLDASLEGANTTLDNSVVVVSNDMSEGSNHFDHNVPFLLAGSCGGFFKTGRVVEMNNAPNNQLLTTLCHAMGIPVASVGDKYTGDVDAALTM